MLIPENESDENVRMVEELELSVRRVRKSGVGFKIVSDLRPLEEVGEDEPIRIHGDRPFEMLVYALYHGYQQEMTLGMSWEDYLDDVVRLLELIHKSDGRFAGRRDDEPLM